MWKQGGKKGRGLCIHLSGGKKGRAILLAEKEAHDATEWSANRRGEKKKKEGAAKLLNSLDKKRR